MLFLPLYYNQLQKVDLKQEVGSDKRIARKIEQNSKLDITLALFERKSL